jgi:cell division protein FtsB
MYVRSQAVTPAKKLRGEDAGGYFSGCVQPKLSYSRHAPHSQGSQPPHSMSIELEVRPAPRKAAGGPEPLRRKRVPAATGSSSPARRKWLNVLLAFAAAVLLVDALVGDKGFLEGLRARRAYEEAEASLNRLRRQNAGLMEDVRRYREDPAAVEGLAREEFGFIKPGETLFIIRDVTPQGR